MSNKNLGPQIKLLSEQGYNYDQIKEKLKCSKGTISYHLGAGQKYKTNIRRKQSRAKQHPFVSKFNRFKHEKQSKYIKPKPTYTYIALISAKINLFCATRKGQKIIMYNKKNFTVDDVIKKFENTKQCYLTGDIINVNKPREYNFDHIIPISRGGTNDLDNLGICTKAANQAKSDMTPDEFYNFCKKVLEHQGYTVTK